MASEKGRYLKDHKPKKVLGDYKEEKAALFEKMACQTEPELLELLDHAYQAMTPPQRREVFGELLEQLRPKVFAGVQLVQQIQAFCDESARGEFYVPFDIDSKNFTHIPAETQEWFDRLGDFLNAATALADHGEYHNAVEAFELLYELIDSMESGDEIVFADECGSWMIPVREEECVAAYLKAVAKIENDVGFANTAVEMLRRDKSKSFSLKVYPSALSCGNPEQVAAFEAKIQKHGLPIKANW